MSKTRIYCAAPWAYRDAAAKVAQRLTAWGYDLTHHWWEHVDVDMADGAAHTGLQKQALGDLKGVLACDVFVILDVAESEGKATELGVAIANGIPIVVVRYPEGAFRNIFYHVPGIVWARDAEHDLHDVLETLCPPTKSRFWGLPVFSRS